MDLIEQAAAHLLAARSDPARRTADLPEPPRTQADAYAIQSAIQAELGPIGGWKVGAAPGGMTCAPLPAAGIHHSPAQLSGPAGDIEAEIAVTLAADLPPRDPPYTGPELLAAIAAAHPAIELLGSRFLDPAAATPLSALADSLSHRALIVGPEIPGWQDLDLAAESVAVLVDGKAVKHGRGNPAGDMLPLLLFLANEGARWAGGLKAGQIVTTGSWTGKDPVPAGSAAAIRFAHAGEAHLRLG